MRTDKRQTELLIRALYEGNVQGSEYGEYRGRGFTHASNAVEVENTAALYELLITLGRIAEREGVEVDPPLSDELGLGYIVYYDDGGPDEEVE